MFKALLFLAAGAIIHAMSDEQDIRRMGGLILLLPQSYAFILLGSLSLMAFPFLTGFYSKDLILELALVPRNFTHSVAYILALVAAILTATYSVRMTILVFISRPHMPRTLLTTIHDPSISMFIPLVILGLGSAFVGYLTHDLFLGAGSTFYLNALFTHPNHATAIIDSPLATVGTVAYLPLAITFLAILALLPISLPRALPLAKTRVNSIIPNFAQYTSGVKGSMSNLTTYSSTLGTNIKYSDTPNSGQMALLPSAPSTPFNTSIHSVSLYTGILSHYNIFNLWIMQAFLNIAVHIYRDVDRGLILLLGPIGLVSLFHYLSHQLELLATGFIPHYAFIILSFLFVLVITLIGSPLLMHGVNILEIIALILLLFFIV